MCTDGGVTRFREPLQQVCEVAGAELVDADRCSGEGAAEVRRDRGGAAAVGEMEQPLPGGAGVRGGRLVEEFQDGVPVEGVDAHGMAMGVAIELQPPVEEGVTVEVLVTDQQVMFFAGQGGDADGHGGWCGAHVPRVPFGVSPRPGRAGTGR